MAQSGVSSNYSPQKSSNGQYIYSKSKRVNQVLNQVGASESRVVQNHNQAQGFGQNNQANLTSGVFSSPQTGPNPNFFDIQQLSEEELSIIVEFEEEYMRLGNFERIFPLNSNVVHYSKFFEYKRPSNLLLTKYLKSLPQGCSSIQGAKF